MEDNKDYEEGVFTLTDEDGKEINFTILGQHQMNGEHYIALVPAEEFENDDENDEITEFEYIILKLAKDGDEEILVTVDDDDEFDDIADYFDDLFSQAVDYDD